MNAVDKAEVEARKRERWLRLEHEAGFTPLHWTPLDWRDCPTCVTLQEIEQIQRARQAPPIPIRVSPGIGRRKLLRSLQPMWPFMPEVQSCECGCGRRFGMVDGVRTWLLDSCRSEGFLHQLDEPQYDFIGESRRQRRRRTLNTGIG